MKGNSSWLESLHLYPVLTSFVREIEVKYKKEVLLADVASHPRAFRVRNLYGTVLDGRENIHVYLNTAFIEAFKPQDEHFIAHLVSHELLHYQMDSEGYPVTENTSAYRDDEETVAIGTAIQDVVCHMELSRRQKSLGLPIIPQRDPVDALILALRHQGELDPTTHQIARISEVLATPESALLPKDALRQVAEIIEILGLQGRLIAYPATSSSPDDL